MLASIKIENTTYLILKIKEEGIPYASIRNNIDSFFIKFIPLSIYMEANLDIDIRIQEQKRYEGVDSIPQELYSQLANLQTKYDYMMDQKQKEIESINTEYKQYIQY